MVLPFLEQKPETLKSGIPIERVKELSSRGFSEVDIIDVLKREGYTPEEIDSALTQTLKMSVGGISPPDMKELSLPKAEDLLPKHAPVEIPETSLPEGYYTQYEQQQYPSEEYIHYIVSERTAELSDKLKEFVIKYSELEKKMIQINEQLNELSKSKSTGEQLIIAKLDEFKNLLADMETRLDGLEKAFKEALPALIESVRALSDVVRKMKKEV